MFIYPGSVPTEEVEESNVEFRFFSRHTADPLAVPFPGFDVCD